MVHSPLVKAIKEVHSSGQQLQVIPNLPMCHVICCWLYVCHAYLFLSFSATSDEETLSLAHKVAKVEAQDKGRSSTDRSMSPVLKTAFDN